MWNISSYDNVLKWGIYLESYPDFPARSPSEVGFPHLATTGFLLVSFHQTELSHDTWPHVLFWTGNLSIPYGGCRVHLVEGHSTAYPSTACTTWKIFACTGPSAHAVCYWGHSLPLSLLHGQSWKHGWVHLIQSLNLGPVVSGKVAVA